MSTVPLGEICNVQIGRTPPRSDPRYWGGSNPWASISDLNQGLLITRTKEGITEEGAHAGKLVQPGTVLISFKLSIGKVSIAGIPLYTNEAIAALPIKYPSTLDARYLLRYLESLSLEEGANRAAMGRTLNKKTLSELPIPLPPLDEQRRIAAILDKADAIRQKRRQTITNLESLSNSMLENQFLGDSRSTTSYALGDLLRSITTGNSPKCRDRPAGTDEWGVLKLSAITSGKFEPTENKSFPGAISEIAKYEVRPGDLLFTRKNTPELVGTATIATSPPPRLAFPDLVFRLEVFEDLVSSIFLQALLMSSTMRNRVRALAVGTSKSMSNISGGRLRGLTIALPSLQRQLQFEQFQRKVLSATHRYSKLLDRDNELFRSLQSRAFRGEL
ncbi:restriction endonuclease subunit S [Brevibacterium linens]|uniref:Type I restriction enzyme, S subunit n=1 Tax=Brevibacterium linens TaxID=1703 RepID=A0A2H1K769_BRELN|nr:restriction endonuclease subunit S [Brevibacterium linens]AZT99839.1 restriction endonuclease subunit S [Brevibacterium linens]SMX95635.1 type I restriction enzyme, S subunit [Brevibacterium linens]